MFKNDPIGFLIKFDGLDVFVVLKYLVVIFKGKFGPETPLWPILYPYSEGTTADVTALCADIEWYPSTFEFGAFTQKKLCNQLLFNVWIAPPKTTYGVSDFEDVLQRLPIHNKIEVVPFGSTLSSGAFAPDEVKC